jgi:hypothetical protein
LLAAAERANDAVSLARAACAAADTDAPEARRQQQFAGPVAVSAGAPALRGGGRRIGSSGGRRSRPALDCVATGYRVTAAAIAS